MIEKETSELDVWIAEHVMGWKKCKLGQIEAEGQFAAQGSEIFIHDRGNYVKTFHPATDPAAAMMVLEKCAEKVEQNQGVSIVALPACFQVSRATSVDYEPDDYSLHSESPTLPLAICLFAKELFK